MLCYAAQLMKGLLMSCTGEMTGGYSDEEFCLHVGKEKFAHIYGFALVYMLSDGDDNGTQC